MDVLVRTLPLLSITAVNLVVIMLLTLHKHKVLSMVMAEKFVFPATL